MPFNIRRFLTVRGRHENSLSPFLSALSAEEDFFLLLFFSFVTCDSAAQVALEQMVMGMDPAPSSAMLITPRPTASET